MVTLLLSHSVVHYSIVCSAIVEILNQNVPLFYWTMSIFNQFGLKDIFTSGLLILLLESYRSVLQHCGDDPEKGWIKDPLRLHFLPYNS